jgi:hypothetical protein
MKLSYIKKNIKGVFKLPKKRYYFGRLRHGSPIYFPRNFNSTILTIRKVKPQFLRCKSFKLFGYNISYGTPVTYVKYELFWKDKFDSPRHEFNPSFQILLFNWQFCIWWCAPDGDDDKYYEMILWYLLYSDKDINKAKETWGWVNYDTKKSTWNDNYLV